MSTLNLATPTTIAMSTVIAMLLIWWLWSALNWVWLRPKRIERRLKQQGLQGNSYRPLIGDIRDMVKMIKEAKSKPMDPHSNEIAPRVLPFVVHTIAKYGQSLKYNINIRILFPLFLLLSVEVGRNYCYYYYYWYNTQMRPEHHYSL